MGNAVKKISENEGAVEMSVLKSDPVTVPGVNNQKEGSSVYSPDPDPVLDSGSVSGSVQAKVPELSLLERIQKVEEPVAGVASGDFTVQTLFGFDVQPGIDPECSYPA
jgi:hypothetical protein